MLRNVMQRAKAKHIMCVRCVPSGLRACRCSLFSMQSTPQPHKQIARAPGPFWAGHTSPASGYIVTSARRRQLLTGLKLSLLLLAMADKAGALSPVPAGLTELSTSEGQQMLGNSTPTDGFWLLAQEFTTQDSQDWCGLASASMVLNALPIPKPALNAFEGWVSSHLRFVWLVGVLLITAVPHSF